MFFRELHTALSHSTVRKTPLNAEIYRDMEQIKSKLEVASQIIQSRLSLRPAAVEAKLHPVLMSFLDFDEVILVATIAETVNGLHEWANENRYRPGDQ